MKEKLFIIRQNIWHYSDQCYYQEKYGEEGGVYSICYSLEEAKEKWLKLERNAFRENLCELPSYEVIFNGDEVKEKKFIDYLINDLKLPSDLSEWSHELEEYSFLFPPTNKQIDEIRNILGISFFKIIEINISRPNFFIPTVNPKCLKNENDTLRINEFFKNDNATPFFNTQISALKFGYNRIINWYEENVFEIKGVLNKLTNNPVVLKKYIDSSSNIAYDHANEELLLTKIKLDDFMKIHSLLNEKPIIVKRISLSEARMIYNIQLVDEKDYSQLKIPLKEELEKLKYDWEKKYDSPYY